MKTERRYSPLVVPQAGSPHFEGRVMRYNSIGQGDYGPERFEPGAFGPDVEHTPILLNVQHDRGRVLARSPGTLRLVDSHSVLTAIAKPPDTAEARDTKLLVMSGVLTGFSIEFRTLAQRQENGTRVISRAELVGLAIVDEPAYAESVVEARRRESRARLGLRIRGLLAYNRPGDCSCQRGVCDKVMVNQGAYKDALVQDRIILVKDSYDGPIASSRKGSLILRDTKEGLAFESALPDSTSARDLVAEVETIDVVARPVMNQEASTFTESDGVATYQRAALRAIALVSTDASDGWEPIELVEPEARRASQRRAGRFPIWL